MTAPGPSVGERLAIPAPTAPTDTGVAFVGAAATQGPTSAQRIQTLDQLVRVYGARDTVGGLYDGADQFFKEGGTDLYVARITGAGGTSASRTLKDASVANTLTLTANGPGTWGNSLNVAVAAGIAVGTYVIQLLLGSTLVEQSPDLTTVQDAVNWANQSSKYVTAVQVGTNGVPAVASSAALSGGAEGSAITDTERVASLAQFPDSLGPGQVFIPGATSSVVGLAVLAHAIANNRFGLVDLPDTPTVATLTAAVASLAGANARQGMALAPWIQVQGVTNGTTRNVPPSWVTAGMMARVDASAGAGTPAAGENGQSVTAIGLSQNWTLASDRDTLNASGVNIFRSMFGGFRLYGYRTAANPSSQQPYIQASQVRYLMSLKARLQAAAESFVFRKIDGKRHVFLDFAGALQAVLQADYDSDQLYGASPAEAFAVDVSAAVNTPTTIAAGELHAVVAVRVVPFAERVPIEIVKVPVTQNLPVAA